MSKEEITKHKSETHEVAVALSRAYPELAVALSPFGYAQGKLRRRGSRMGRRVEWEGSCFEFSFLEIHNCYT